MIDYVLTFVFNPAITRILLIKKNRPSFLAGNWNGIGGKIEANELPRAAAHRELLEEAGITAELHHLADVLVDKEACIYCFYGISNDFEKYKTLTDEVVRPTGIKTLHQIPVDTEAAWLIMLAYANLKGRYVRTANIVLHDALPDFQDTVEFADTTNINHQK